MQKLHERDSAAKCTNASWRHEQLCRQNKFGEEFISKIQPFREKLEADVKALRLAKRNLSKATDQIRLADIQLDDELRKVHSRCKEYDRDFPGQNIRELLFPEGNLTPIIAMSISDEPAEARQIAKKIEALGEENPLFPLAAQIQGYVENCNAGQVAQKVALEDIAKTRTEIALSKNALIRQYSRNFHLAAAEYGKRYAERLFPELYSSHTESDDETDETEEAA